ncbi:MAG: hypothetical protein QG644_272 [Patescibacteria group bacterium]|nr:hypothetical protein [Patescibacteria group bacterium]
MQPETRNCQNCKNDFTIETEDFNFYEKIKVPPPTWCPECRVERRLSFVNAWNIFWRNCDKCGNKTMSAYHPDEKMKVFCQPCWWKDDWDGTEYAMEYNPNKPFLEQVKELQDKTPHVALETNYTTLKNSEYCNGVAWVKDCYLTFWADYCDNVFYSSILNNLKYSSDCLRAQDSELCYEAIGISKCYQTFFSEECDACVDVWFSRNCYSCTNCIGCANLRGASYCIFNIKYSKEEFEQKVKELRLDSWRGLQELKEEARKFWVTKPKREYNGNTLNKNVTGEYVFNSKNAKEMYVCVGAEDCKWCQFISVGPAKECIDYSGWGNNVSQMYECGNVGENAAQCKFSFYCFPDSLNLEYCGWCTSGKNNLGCMNLKRKQYCILNKQYSKEEFEKLKLKILEDMKVNPYVDKLGRNFFYGEFFPLEFSKFPYNKSNAIRFFPKKKEDAITQGYYWLESENLSSNISIESSSLPDSINDTNELILNDIISCSLCRKGYKVTKGELDLLRKLKIPLSHECPKCRENDRFNRCNSPKLYQRSCDKCKKEISSAFSPNRAEIVYCVECYQAEFL